MKYLSEVFNGNSLKSTSFAKINAQVLDFSVLPTTVQHNTVLEIV